LTATEREQIDNWCFKPWAEETADDRSAAASRTNAAAETSSIADLSAEHIGNHSVQSRVASVTRKYVTPLTAGCSFHMTSVSSACTMNSWVNRLYCT